MLHLALYEPEIPPNTGNIIRLCANTGVQLHLIYPLGFEMETKALRRAGLDYREWAQVVEHKNFKAFMQDTDFNQIYALTTKATEYSHQVTYVDNDCMLLGPETRGLPEVVRGHDLIYPVRIPMKADSRSLNLSNTAAVVVYQALAQLGFPDLK